MKAIAAAKEFAGDRVVDVAAGQIGSQALELGLIGQVVVNQVPVVFNARRSPLATVRRGQASVRRGRGYSSTSGSRSSSGERTNCSDARAR